jgi:hypothetical protein
MTHESTAGGTDQSRPKTTLALGAGLTRSASILTLLVLRIRIAALIGCAWRRTSTVLLLRRIGGCATVLVVALTVTLLWGVASLLVLLVALIVALLWRWVAALLGRIRATSAVLLLLTLIVTTSWGIRTLLVSIIVAAVVFLAAHREV